MEIRRVEGSTRTARRGASTRSNVCVLEHRASLVQRWLVEYWEGAGKGWYCRVLAVEEERARKGFGQVRRKA